MAEGVRTHHPGSLKSPSAPTPVRRTATVLGPNEERWRAALDRVLSLILLVMLAPVFLIVAIAVKLDCRTAPVFYRQIRVGVNRRTTGATPVGGERRAVRGSGKPFEIWKFRTMIPDAEAESGPVWATLADPRITRVGKMLRQTRMDELPQLINVLRGEMRLVGPRPERPQFVESLSAGVPGYEDRLRVPPGITGLAQVERAYDENVEDVRTKLRYDLFYIQNRRPMMDLKILLKTFSVVFGRRGSR